jgi:hypothetical protein
MLGLKVLHFLLAMILLLLLFFLDVVQRIVQPLLV